MGTHGLNEVQAFCEVFISGNLFLLSVTDEDDKKMTQTKDRHLQVQKQSITPIAGMAFSVFSTITDDYLYCNLTKRKGTIKNLQKF